MSKKGLEKSYFKKEDLESSGESQNEEEIDSDLEAQRNAEQKTKKPEAVFIFKEEQILRKARHLQTKFKKRILQVPKVKSKSVNFSEHMSIVSDRTVNLADIDINNDIQREVELYEFPIFFPKKNAFLKNNSYNITLENVNKALETLNEEGIAVDRPDDFYVDMFKNDKVMQKVKNRLVKQQVKIQNFEEKKTRIENKKFAKQLKARKEQEKSKEKKKTVDAINNWKEEIKTKGEKARDLSDFIMAAGNNKNEAGKKGSGKSMNFFGGKGGKSGKGGSGGRGGGKGGDRPFFKKMSNKSKRISKMRGNKSKKGATKRPGKVQRMINKNKKKSFSSKGKKK